MLGLLTLAAVVLAASLGVYACHKLHAFVALAAWIKSTTEEKVGLTKLAGHFNANGYLVHSDSDVYIGHSGSFKRFDSFDRDIKLAHATTSFGSGAWFEREEAEARIPPQPLRPAPVPTISAARVVGEAPSPSPLPPTETSIKPLPRPVSSVSVSAMQQSNAQFIPPPPAHGASADYGEVVAGALKRAVSCESVCSDTSVALGDLEESSVTGYLCIGLEYDSENGEMIANVLEAKDLVHPSIAISGAAGAAEPMDTYVKIFLLPDKNVSVQTKVCRSSNSPSYQERVIFALHPRDQLQTALLFHIYATDAHSHTLIGDGELSLADVSLRQPVTTWVTLTDTSQSGAELGELMFSLSYLPTAERLTVVVVKGRKLKLHSEREQGEPFVKAYLLQYGKKIHKKKTSTRKPERSPIFNESMMFNIPAHMLQTIQIRLTVAELQPEAARAHAVGHVIVGAQASGRSLAHWNQMLQALRRPVAMWHPLRK